MNKQFLPSNAFAVSALVWAIGISLAPSLAQASEEDILKRIDAIQAQINALKGQIAATPAAAPAASAGKTAAISNTDGITLFGRLDVGIEANNDGNVQRTAVQSQKSYIGFRAERNVGLGLTALMQIDTTVAPDDNAGSTTFANRNSFVGLRSASAGTFRMGRFDEPIKLLQGNSALLWGSADAMEVIINGKTTQADIVGMLAAMPNVTAADKAAVTAATAASLNKWASFHNRTKNVFQYVSPKMNDFQIVLAYSPDEVAGATGTIKKPIYGGSVEYNNGKWNLGVATETLENYGGDGFNMSALKATGGMKLGELTFGLAFSTLDNHAGRKTDNWMVAASYKFGPTVLKANYGEASESKSNARDGSKMFGLELDYPLDKNTTAYGYYSTIDNDNGGYGKFEAGTNLYVVPKAGQDPKVIGLGIRYAF